MKHINQPRSDRKRVVASTLLLLIVALAIAPVTLSSQNQSHTVEKQFVRFKRGRTSATLRGMARSDKSYVYVLHASHGQRMDVRLTSTDPKTTFSLIAPDTETFNDGFSVTSWSGELVETGEYKIVVVNNSDAAKVAYTLRVAIR